MVMDGQLAAALSAVVRPKSGQRGSMPRPVQLLVDCQPAVDSATLSIRTRGHTVVLVCAGQMASNGHVGSATVRCSCCTFVLHSGLLLPKPSRQADCQWCGVPDLRRIVRRRPLTSIASDGDSYSLGYSGSCDWSGGPRAGGQLHGSQVMTTVSCHGSWDITQRLIVCSGHWDNG